MAELKKKGIMGLKKNSNPFSLSLKYKFILLFCLLITIPFMISGILTYRKYSANVQESAVLYTSQIMEQIQINLDRYVKDIERITLSPFYNENVMQILLNHDGQPQHPRYLTTDESLKMNLFLSSLSFDRTEIQGIFIFANDGNLFSNLALSVKNRWTAESLEWMKLVLKKEGGLAIIPPHQATYYKEPLNSVISLARTIREPYTHKTLGIVKVDLTPNGFNEILSIVSLSESSRLYILDRNGHLLYSTVADTQLPSSDLAEWAKDNDFLYAEAVSDYTGLKVIGLIQLDDLRKEARELTSFTLIISLMSLTLAYILAIITSNRLVRPIRHLQSKMKLVQKGVLKERAMVMSNDEIGQLATVFNEMVEEIDRLVKQVYETTIREKEAELSALQSQINPHFLYNTLETMNMLALQQQNFALSGMITSLGKLLRYTVDKQERPVHLKDEIRFVESYLQIQSLRLGDKLRMEIHVDPVFEDCLVPKLILQPLIENVIEHGLGDRAQVSASLRAKTEDDDLILTVSDNGAGMSPERTQWLERQLDLSFRDEFVADRAATTRFGKIKKGFALRNVHQRIRLLYGEPYGLEVDKTVKQGATFRIRLPLQWEYMP